MLTTGLLLQTDTLSQVGLDLQCQRFWRWDSAYLWHVCEMLDVSRMCARLHLLCGLVGPGHPREQLSSWLTLRFSSSFRVPQSPRQQHHLGASQAPVYSALCSPSERTRGALPP